MVHLFQFHKGTIKPSGCSFGSGCSLYFNSIKVRLNLSISLYIILFVMNFNSIKVRLNHPYSDRCLYILVWFQFHKGTIKPIRHRLIRKILLIFQFHKGTIKPVLYNIIDSTPEHFNSIKVRLNRNVGTAAHHVRASFQFHKGTIKPPMCPCHRFCLSDISIP